VIQLLDAMIAKHNMATTLKAMDGKKGLGEGVVSGRTGGSKSVPFWTVPSLQSG
jgi:hypothetical protein